MTASRHRGIVRSRLAINFTLKVIVMAVGCVHFLVGVLLSSLVASSTSNVDSIMKGLGNIPYVGNFFSTSATYSTAFKACFTPFVVALLCFAYAFLPFLLLGVLICFACIGQLTIFLNVTSNLTEGHPFSISFFDIIAPEKLDGIWDNLKSKIIQDNEIQTEEALCLGVFITILTVIGFAYLLYRDRLTRKKKAHEKMKVDMGMDNNQIEMDNEQNDQNTTNRGNKNINKSSSKNMISINNNDNHLDSATVSKLTRRK